MLWDKSLKLIPHLFDNKVIVFINYTQIRAVSFKFAYGFLLTTKTSLLQARINHYHR